MLTQKLFEEISQKVSETLANSPVKDVEKNMRAMLGATFSKMDLVTREEFEVQQEVLAHTRATLTRLEQRIAELEAQLATAQPTTNPRRRPLRSNPMRLAVVHSRAQAGIHAPSVQVEVHLANGLPSFTLVGLPDTEVRESRDRVRAAIQTSGFDFPAARLTVNLAPADLPKALGALT